MFKKKEDVQKKKMFKKKESSVLPQIWKTWKSQGISKLIFCGNPELSV